MSRLTQHAVARADLCRLVVAITGDAPPTDAALRALLDDRRTGALACELEAIWHVVGTLSPAGPTGSSHAT